MNNQGFTLLEVLVALLVLSVGLLGIAALQAAGLRNNHSAYLRSQATILAYDITDRMRANQFRAQAGAYDVAAGAMPAGYPGCGGGGTCDCVANVCTTANTAIFDVGQWKDALATVLPGGDGSITRAGTTVRVRVFWDDARTGASGTGCSGDPTVDLTCFTVMVRP